MRDFLRLPRSARLYVAVIVLLGGATLVQSVRELLISPIDKQWLVLAGLTILTGCFSVKVPAITAYLSVSETFVFASVLMFGPAAATVTVLIEILVILFWMDPQARPTYRILFNVAAPAVAIWTAATTFYSFSGFQPYFHGPPPPPLGTLFLPLLALTVLYFLVNSWLVALAVGLEAGKSPIFIWWNNFAWLSVNYFSGASVAALLVTYGRDLDASTLAVIVPLLVVSYLTFRTAMGRAEDSNNHLLQLNRLYLSTIETLAMAIDAKDQITHGHIRRVQTYAIGLAKQLGVIDQNLIKAIEAAALLHDMGKLAVPEYILNKPGKLTAAEYDKMKLHASVGADILSAIDFPYPVVPIVRHHHENWDGTGYPDGLRGTEIPIGARILSVVDCFDALTSDRPYRPAMSDEDALRILSDRRGSMYDPLIVDTFNRVYRDIAPPQSAETVPRSALNEITSSSSNTPVQTISVSPPVLASSSSDEILAVYEVTDALAGHTDVEHTCAAIVDRLKHLVPFSNAVLFIYDISTDELEAKLVVGQSVTCMEGLRIPLGQRLSGWVGANRQTIVNSDPALDLGDTASGTSRLKSSFSTPLISADQLIGVLTLYSETQDAFNDDHRRVIGVVAREIARGVRDSMEFERKLATRDPDTGLPNREQFANLINILRSHYGSSQNIGLVFIDVFQMPQISMRFGRSAGIAAMGHAANLVRQCLRVTDILFRYGDSELVVLLNDTDGDALNTIAVRISEAFRSNPVEHTALESFQLQVNVTVSDAPFDSDGLKGAARLAATSAGHLQVVR